jgi:hypothetical protein
MAALHKETDQHNKSTKAIAPRDRIMNPLHERVLREIVMRFQGLSLSRKGRGSFAPRPM